jgi:hypothetical protein
MTKEQFLSLTVENISQVYSGKRNVCRCGCAGKYTATTFMVEPRTDDINDALVIKRLKRAQKLVAADTADVDYGDTYIDVETGFDRCLCFYIDEVKK